jgi:uncharacterized membrane protein
MRKNIKSKQGSPSARESALLITQQTAYQGPIPRPDDLEQYEKIANGAALRIIAMAEDEAKHRRKQESEALQANIAMQQQQINLTEMQTKLVFRSDVLGQILGAIVSLASIAGGVYLALSGQSLVALGLVGLPLAGVIRALRNSPKRDKANTLSKGSS